MSDFDPATDGEGEGSDPGVLDEAREAALIRKVLRLQERHREGGIDPELDVGDDDPDGTAAEAGPR